MRSRREEDLLQCPCRAYNIYLRRSQEWLNTVSPETWPVNLLLVPGTHSPASDNVISVLFKDLVKDSYRLLGGARTLFRDDNTVMEDAIGVHQMRKLAATYAIKVGQPEEKVRVKLGFSAVRIMRKNYVAEAPPLRVACVLPGGTSIPDRSHELSDSDSD